MRPGELLLRYQQLDERARAFATEIAGIERSLDRDEDLERAVLEEDAARERVQRANLKLRDLDRDVQDHRTRMRSREKELMSGRVNNPTELMQMSQEVEHAKERLALEEDVELEALTEVEEAEAELKRLVAQTTAIRAAGQAGRPGLETALGQAREHLVAAEAERDGVWTEVPAPYQAAYKRLAGRIPSPVAEVAGGQCGACRVALTASELQQVRRGEQLQNCQNCNRLLVAV